MKYLADTYLARSLSDPTDAWPYLPYPYNTDIHSGKYDGDMRNGKGILQPDKAGNFGYELIVLYKITGEEKYLKAARTDREHPCSPCRTGNKDESPLPFRVNAKTGKRVCSFQTTRRKEREQNFTGTVYFQLDGNDGPVQGTGEVRSREEGNLSKAFKTILWMKEYPLKMNKWGPFSKTSPDGAIPRPMPSPSQCSS